MNMVKASRVLPPLIEGHVFKIPPLKPLIPKFVYYSLLFGVVLISSLLVAYNAYTVKRNIKWFETFDAKPGNESLQNPSPHQDCPKPSWIGDLHCDDLTNIPQCSFDGGDCCKVDPPNNEYCTICQCLDENGIVTTTSTTSEEPDVSVTTTTVEGTMLVAFLRCCNMIGITRSCMPW